MKSNYVRISIYLFICLALVSLGFATYQTGKAAPLHIYVDDDYSGPSDDGGHDWGVDAFATIQEGIDAVEPGGTVHVGPGSYNQALTINKWLLLDGSGSGINPAADTIITSPTTNVITITAGGTSQVNRMVLSNFRAGGLTGNAIYTDSIIQYLTLDGVVIDGATNYGIEIHNSAVVTDLALQDVTLSNNGNGIRIRGQLTGLVIEDSLITGNSIGINTVAASADSNMVSNVTIQNTEVLSNTSKGMYFEKLSSAIFQDLTVRNNGTTGTWPAGIDINLKYEAYSNITISDSLFEDNGTSDTIFGVALAVKARDDGSYAADPASLTGVSIQNNIITGSPQGLRFGEPNRNNAGPTAVTVLNNHFEGNTTALNNATQAVIGSTCNSWDAVSGPTYDDNDGGLGEVITTTSTGAITFQPWLIYPEDAEPTEIGFQLPQTFTVTASADISPAENDFTRIENAVGCAVDGQTVNLSGVFYWNYTNSHAAYMASSAHSSSADIRGVMIPAGVDDLTITSFDFGSAVYNEGDFEDLYYEAFLFADDSPAAAGNNNLTISQLWLESFESGIVLGWNATGFFNGTHILDNFITLGGDNYGVQNIAIYLWRGFNQQITNNHIYFNGAGTRTIGSGARSFGFQNATTGGSAYNGLEIGSNEFIVNPSSTGVELIYGVWENSHNDVDTTVISIHDNLFQGREADVFDRVLLLSSQTDLLEIEGNIFHNVDDVFFSSTNQGHSEHDVFTFGPNILENVGGPDAIFLQNVTNDSTPIHVSIVWDINNQIDTETGILMLNEMSTSAMHAARPLSGATDIEAVTATPMPFLEVYVDDDNAALDRFSDPDGVGLGLGPIAVDYNTFDTIQAGIDAVSSGGIVHVLAGEYVENVAVDKPVEIAGVGQADVSVYPALSNPDCRFGGSGSICSGGTPMASNVFQVEANDVIIHGLTVDGDNPALTSGVVRGGADLDARNGIIHNHSIGSFDNTEIYSTTVRNIYLRGIYISSTLSVGFYIHDNTVHNVQGESQSIAIMNWGSSGIIDGNLVYDSNDGITANHSTGTLYLNNEVYNSGSGIHSDNNGSMGGAGDWLTDNYVHDCAVNGYGIWAFYPYEDITLSSNIVENCTVGLTFSGSAGGTAYFTENIVDGMNLPGSVGVYHTTNMFGYGSSDSTAVFTRNTIINNDYSFYLESDLNYVLNSEIHFNRIVWNLYGAEIGGEGTFAVNAENNWWGCNEGPGQETCEPVNVVVDADPWLVLSATALPESIRPSETSTFNANLIWNSDGIDTSSINYLPDGLAVTFTGDPLGVLSPLSALTEDASASSVFTAGQDAGIATLSATVDLYTVTDTVTIYEPVITLDSDAYVVDEGAGSIIITANLDVTSTQTITVDYAALVGTASAADFTPVSGTLTFVPGDLQETFSIPILEDAIDEPAETAQIELSDSLNAAVGDPYTATLTINDNDAAPVINFSSATYTAAEDAGTATIMAILSGQSAYTVSVDYTTIAGTATAGQDYTTSTGTLTFVPGDLEETFTVAITDDNWDELSEDITLRLSNGINATTGPDATLTITDNDPTPTAAFSSATYDIVESGGAATIQVLLSSPSSFPVTLEYTATAGTASAADFTAASGLITFLPGDLEETFTVSITPDLIDEPDETINLALGTPVNAGLGTPSSAVLTILDDDAMPSVSFTLADYSVDEDGISAVIAVQLSSPSAYQVEVSVDTSNGTATAGLDYTAVSEELEFDPGETLQTFSVPILDDLIDEANENVILTLSDPVYATLGTYSSAALTIVDDETPPTISFSVAAYNADEDAGDAVITANLSGEASYPITVDYATSDGTATAGEDYTTTTGTLTFDAGTTTATFDIAVLEDTLDENGETVHISLSNPSTSLGSPSEADLTIADNDLPPVAGFSSLTYSVAEDGVSFLVTVNLSTASALPVTVDYATADGTADAGQDYTAATGTLSFAPLDTQETFSVPILDDTIDELDETVILSLSGAVNATPGPDSTLTITDNEGEPVSAFSSATYSSGEEDGTLAVSVNLSFPSAFEVTVDYSTVVGSAGAADFTSTSGTLTFIPGDITETFTVTILEDAIDEPDETFSLHLSNPVNASAGPDASATIVDNDATPTVSFSEAAYSAGESDGTATITAVLSGASGNVVSVDYNTLNGTAGSADYTSTSGTLTFQPGDLEETFTVAITEDLVDETDETVILQLSNPVNAGAGADATLTIVDNDQAPVASFTGDPFSVTESVGTTTITVSLSAASEQTVSIDFATEAGTATPAVDYTPASGTLTFLPGETEQSFDVTVIADDIDEPDETVELVLSNPVNCISGPEATLTLLDDDDEPVLSFSVATYDVDEYAGTVTVTVDLSRESAYEVSVVYHAEAGTASSSDFTPVTGTLTFVPGDLQETFTVNIMDDLLDEGDETVILSLTDPVQASTGPNAVLTILDDDDPPTVQLSAADYSVVEDTGTAIITTTLSAPSGLEVTVGYAATDGTAGSSDYTTVTGVLTFTAGQTEAVFEVEITADSIAEADETILLDLSDPINASLGVPVSGTLTIIDDEGLPQVDFSSAEYSVAENGSTAVITVTLDSMSASEVSVDFETLFGTAGSGDFTPISGTLTFAPGETAATFTVTILNDGLDEADETIILHLSNPVNATAGPDAVLTIIDDDVWFYLYMPIVNKELGR